MGSRSELRIAGPLAAFASEFRQDLVARGYRPGPASDQSRLISDVSRWLAERGREAAI
jgi:integrase/recombinase XerD